MPDRIATYDAAIKEMLAWANGEKSHHNSIYAAAFNTANGSGIAGALVPIADASEVQKWAAVASVLRIAPLDVEWPDDDRLQVERSLLEDCRSAIELEWGRTETVLRLEEVLGKKS